jgi:hypothetical protein
VPHGVKGGHTLHRVWFLQRIFAGCEELRTTQGSTEKPAKKTNSVRKRLEGEATDKTHIGWVLGEEVGRPSRVPSIGGQIIDEVPDGVTESVRNVGRKLPGTKLSGNCSL